MVFLLIYLFFESIVYEGKIYQLTDFGNSIISSLVCQWGWKLAGWDYTYNLTVVATNK